MEKKNIVITGAAGFIGSSLVIALSSEYRIAAIDQRKPSPDLINAAPEVRWLGLDISDAERVTQAFRNIKTEFRRIDFVIHLAAFYHFGDDWRTEYELTNIRGTENIVRGAISSGAQRLIFTSSIAALEPPSDLRMLNERSTACDYIPYAKSKREGEQILRNASWKIPGIILRLGGVFSDWCELPPLFSLINLWTSIKPFSRIIPGEGKSGMPYIHLDDVIMIFKRCLTLNSELSNLETFLVSQSGVTTHRELFDAVRQILHPENPSAPIFVSKKLLKIGLMARTFFGPSMNRDFFEQPWMLKYLDRPWKIDNRYTCNKLDWNLSPEKKILVRIPLMLDNLKKEKNKWIRRNARRNIGRYYYSGIHDARTFPEYRQFSN